MVELIPEDGNFYKVNMHCHTNISDGKRSPEEVKEFYKKAGYSAVCFTDHEVLVPHRDLCDEEFIALHGYEVAIKKDLNAHTAYFMPVYHFNMIAESQDTVIMPSFYKNNPSFAGNSAKWAESVAVYNKTIEETVYDIDWLNEYLESVHNGGYLINYNHPEWSLQNVNDYSKLRNIHSMEIINGGCFKLNENTSLHYDQMLRSGNRVVPTAGDDNHSENNCFKGWTMIKARELSYESLIFAYKKGNCYVSEGPEILSVVLVDDKIIVKTSDVYSIVLRSEGRYSEAVISEEGKCREAIFKYSPEKMGRYFRIEIRDAKGFKAFSNAYYTDDIAAKFK